ncbi:MAG TPA: bifunctional oligoribonuclease/PAP phosphatase NrnA [Haloplasmataceae bacterium]
MNYILNKIREHNIIIIHRHNRPDGDCMGSQLGLKDIIINSFKDKKVYVVGDEEEEFFYLGRMDHIDDEIYEKALVFVLDVANTDRISDLRYQKGKELIKIDHHPFVTKYCDYEWIDTSYASCCEMITDFFRQNKHCLKLSNEGAKALLYGMITDTNRFITPVVNKRTFELVTLLLDYSINLNEVYQHIYDENINITRLRGYVAENFTCTTNGLGYIKLNKTTCDKYHVNASISNTLVNTLSNTSSVKAYFVAIYDDRTDKIRISLRSKGIPINGIAEKYGGGGHVYSSGMMLDNMELVDDVVKDLDLLLENYK